MSFFTPPWTGVVSVAGRTITRISGSSFTDGFPGVGMALTIDTADLELWPTWVSDFQRPKSYLPQAWLDGLGRFPAAFRTWFVDSDHLETNIDTTYDLLIVPFTAGYSMVDYILPAFDSGLVWASGSDATSNPSSSVRTARAASLGIAYPPVFHLVHRLSRRPA
jgi:hypothetical protein